jgi:spore germination cell wall hydrolase CwlJ-like protein
MKHILYVNTKILVLLSLIFVSLLMPAKVKTNIAHTSDQIANSVKKIDMKQLICMANNIFYEAGSETVTGQAAVARVVMNRVRHGFGADPCKVIYQVTKIDDKKICQFSWVCEGKTTPNKNDPRYLKAMDTAYQVMVHDAYKDVVTKSTLFFHNTSVEPNWPHKRVVQIGNHIFYAKNYKKQ